jgi:hypothetical protein
VTALVVPHVADRSRRHGSWGWTFVCPVTPSWCGLGSLHDGFETPDHCRAGWHAHATNHHPDQPIGWPEDTPGEAPPPWAGTQPVDSPRFDDGVQALLRVSALLDVHGVPLSRDCCRTTWRWAEHGEPMVITCRTHRPAPWLVTGDVQLYLFAGVTV